MSSFWKIFISVVVTAGIVGGGGWWYMDQKASDDKAELQTQIDDLNEQITNLKASSSTSGTSSAAATTDETADWKTYTNTTYGFSIKYPSDWSVSDKLQEKGGASTISQYLKLSATDASITIYFEPTGWGTPTPEIKYTAAITNQKLTLTSRVVVPDPGEEGIAQENGLISLQQNNSFALKLGAYNMSISASNVGLAKEQTIVKMLQTFKFTN